MVKFTDIGAYFGGRAFGKHKLIFWLSPGKTWEGLFFGLLTAGLVGVPFAALGLPAHVPWWKGFIFGVVIGGIGQLGDLLESLMKRDAEVKDSRQLVPGFGGILDIIDSPLRRRAVRVPALQPVLTARTAAYPLTTNFASSSPRLFTPNDRYSSLGVRVNGVSG